PVIQRPKGNESAEEGCLSLPGLYGTVVRPKEISLSAYDLSGKQIEARVSGFPARVLMHENDHLDGVLFFDRMPEESRGDIYGPLEEFEINFRSKQATGAIPSDDVLIAR